MCRERSVVVLTGRAVVGQQLLDGGVQRQRDDAVAHVRGVRGARARAARAGPAHAQPHALRRQHQAQDQRAREPGDALWTCTSHHT